MPLLYNIKSNILELFDLIIVEMHCIGNHGDKGGGDQGPIKDPIIKIKCLENLSILHDLVHISPNKIVSPLDLNLGYSLPYVAELRYIKKIKPQRNYNFPTILDTNYSEKSTRSTEYLKNVSNLYENISL